MTVSSPSAPADHIPAPHQAARRSAMTNGDRIPDLPQIDAHSICSCGQAIVNDELYGWLHLGSSPEAMQQVLQVLSR